MGIKKFQLFLLGKKSIKPTKSAHTCLPIWPIEGVLMTSTSVLSERFPKISWNIWKDLSFFLTFTGKNVGDNRFWSQVISMFEGRFAPPWTVKDSPQLVSLISPMLPRSRSCHLYGTIFVYGRIDSINKKIGEMSRSKEKSC